MCPSFGFISPIRHLVHVLKITLQLIANAGKEGQSDDLLRNLFLTPEKENKMVIMQMHTALMSIQMRTTFFHEFLPNSKSKYLGWPRRRLLSYWCHWKATLSKLSWHCFWFMSLRGKTLLPPKSTENFPLIFKQLGFCPRFVWTQDNTSFSNRNWKRLDHDTFFPYVVGGWLRTAQVPQQGGVETGRGSWDLP